MVSESTPLTGTGTGSAAGDAGKLKILGILAGVALLPEVLLGSYHHILREQPRRLVVDAYILILSILILAVESSAAARSAIAKQAIFVQSISGRSIFFLIAGTLELTRVRMLFARLVASFIRTRTLHT
jgi:hypothetical protein